MTDLERALNELVEALTKHAERMRSLLDETIYDPTTDPAWAARAYDAIKAYNAFIKEA